MTKRLPSVTVFALLLATFMTVYASVWSLDFGITDDYPDFFYGTEGAHVEKRVLEGRPLLALLGLFFTSLATELEDLRYIRIVGIVGIALLAWSLFQVLVRAGYGRFQSFCVGAIVGTSLPFQLCAAWATLAYSSPYAAASSGLAFLLADRAYDDPSPRRWVTMGGAILCLLAAFAIYQPVAMFFWVFVAIRLLKPEGISSSDILRRFAWYCVVVATSAVLGFALYKLGPAIYPDYHHVSRGGLISIEDIPERIVWFYHPLKDSLNFLFIQDFYRNSLLPVTITITSFIVAGLVLYFRGGIGRRLLNMALAVTFLFLSHIVMLTVERHEGGYRVLPALVSLIILYLYLALQGYLSLLHRFALPRRANVVVGAVTIACLLAAAWQVRSYFVLPQVRELAFISSQLAHHDLSEYRGIHIIRPGPFDEFVSMQYSAASSRFPWTVKPIIGFVLRDLAAEYASLPVTSSAFDDPSPPPQGSLVVDIREGIVTSSR